MHGKLFTAVCALLAGTLVQIRITDWYNLYLSKALQHLYTPVEYSETLTERCALKTQKFRTKHPEVASQKNKILCIMVLYKFTQMG